jgi:hypothetical protein
MRSQARMRRLAVVLALVGGVVVSAVPAYAQRGNYLMGTLGLLGGSQAFEGIYYQNVFNYYQGSEFQSVSANRGILLAHAGRFGGWVFTSRTASRSISTTGLACSAIPSPRRRRRPQAR